MPGTPDDDRVEDGYVIVDVEESIKKSLKFLFGLLEKDKTHKIVLEDLCYKLADGDLPSFNHFVERKFDEKRFTRTLKRSDRDSAFEHLKNLKLYVSAKGWKNVELYFGRFVDKYTNAGFDSEKI